MDIIIVYFYQILSIFSQSVQKKIFLNVDFHNENL